MESAKKTVAYVSALRATQVQNGKDICWAYQNPQIVFFFFFYESIWLHSLQPVVDYVPLEFMLQYNIIETVLKICRWSCKKLSKCSGVKANHCMP